MSANESQPESGIAKQARVCHYLGLLEDSKTTLSFPSSSNLCYHAKPLASPNMEYQRLVCLKGRRHTLCPVFLRSEIGSLPPDISDGPATMLLLGMPVEKRVLLPLWLGFVVLVLGLTGLMWLISNQTGRTPGSPIPTSTWLPFASETIPVTAIPIFPNIDPSVTANVDDPVSAYIGTITPQLPTLFSITPIPTQTKILCGSPDTWVVYIVRPGDSLYHLSLVFAITIAELQRANCLGTSSILHTGQLLHVPSTAPLAPSPTIP
ncbi:MAG: LysM peptidoglycan-binding domain-containing protein [Anaerolineales bacterium]|jgi:LysM repeat protein